MDYVAKKVQTAPSELTFRALLTEGDTERLELEKG
jgi:hypothetical protein